ncbi:uncharacterized protein LOC129717469 isoform X3 [Wyeomyia smithii]|uniref:uncharacterized protein LOC129717469 isoform X3 n=1 Tax=Wyeomyia smithii TaxID=174621 RepID=UPI00246804A6|nr:uncharacterized protein LOC129717469 isoform X3 [Wyeomyia smithii]
MEMEASGTFGGASQAAKEIEAAKIKLNIIGFDRKEEIMNLWITSYPLRRFQSVTGKLAFGDWDALTHYADVHQLISVDFKKILPNHVRLEERIFPFVRRFKNIFENYKQLIVEDMDLLNNLASIFTDHFQLTVPMVSMDGEAHPEITLAAVGMGILAACIILITLIAYISRRKRQLADNLKAIASGKLSDSEVFSVSGRLDSRSSHRSSTATVCTDVVTQI